MSGKDKATKSLRKENSNLRSEIDSLKTHVMRLEERLREEQAAKGNLESRGGTAIYGPYRYVPL